MSGTIRKNLVDATGFWSCCGGPLSNLDDINPLKHTVGQKTWWADVDRFDLGLPHRRSESLGDEIRNLYTRTNESSRQIQRRRISCPNTQASSR